MSYETYKKFYNFIDALETGTRVDVEAKGHELGLEKQEIAEAMRRALIPKSVDVTGFGKKPDPLE